MFCFFPEVTQFDTCPEKRELPSYVASISLSGPNENNLDLDCSKQETIDKLSICGIFNSGYSESVMEVEVCISEVRCELRGLLALDDKLETRVAYDDTFFHYSISTVKKGHDLL
ncbi:hypothetical protein P8452_34876 [Trifolium repens]|nr:hypothetical protein P8452_34876 [Trifolium repens]